MFLQNFLAKNTFSIQYQQSFVCVMSLYQKYRPANFNALAGQPFIQTVLKNAIASGQTVGAYLFAGPR